MTQKKHQIRLSGDPYFQECLRKALGMLCRLELSHKGQFTEAASIALMLIPASEIVAEFQKGCCPPNAPHAKAPDPQSIDITGEAAGHLARLRGEVILLGETRLNLRGIVHNAICALASKNDAEILERISIIQ
ncbi:MAG: hypothetical protein AAGH41_08230 [Pseudomonadota bacterium]